jgi:hypothetical protein
VWNDHTRHDKTRQARQDRQATTSQDKNNFFLVGGIGIGVGIGVGVGLVGCVMC